ncbi:amidohydrolase family protein [Methanofollis fontis]|uniref:5'-deoxyadenosine deaminase n=1 Tax=Methanofollis fontis TaxID=2052832 RepID=A0A483CT31_9EURY|nr:amidohydrolase family protein [Methanofollis fontis]TAJ44464.1 S-adenosylhomocysteine deaminase [Methanofollis fontis]
MKEIAQGESVLIRDVTLDGRQTNIRIEGKTIVSIGPEPGGETDVVIDGKGGIALPGLYNTHTHSAMSLLRGYADDMPLQQWLGEKIWPLEAHLTAADVYQGTRLACLEMIRTGTVGFNDMYFFMEETARAADEMGMKAQVAYGFIDLFDEEKRENEIRATEKLVRHIRGMNNDRIRAAVGPHAIYTVSPEGLRWCAEFSRQNDIGIHIHLAETEQEVKDCIEQNGMRPAALLDDCGCITPRTVAAHCCWLDADDCTLLGDRGAFASHNPSSNMKLGVHRAMPCEWLRNAGAGICLGTDGCASNNNLDMFEEMKFAALLQKFYWNSQTLLPAAETLSMATAGGAAAMGFDGGRIEVGAPADIVLLDRAAVCNTPLHNPVSNAVYSCNGGAVTTVLCNGRVLMQDRFIPGEEEILREAADAAASLVGRATEQS